MRSTPSTVAERSASYAPEQLPFAEPDAPIDWRSIGGKRRGSHGWVVRSPRGRGGAAWELHAGLVAWEAGSFWRIGLVVESSMSDVIPLAEVGHLRYPREAAAFEAATWLAAVAGNGSA